MNKNKKAPKEPFFTTKKIIVLTIIIQIITLIGLILRDFEVF